jgi:hypothetical protein
VKKYESPKTLKTSIQKIFTIFASDLKKRVGKAFLDIKDFNLAIQI